MSYCAAPWWLFTQCGWGYVVDTEHEMGCHCGHGCMFKSEEAGGGTRPINELRKRYP